MTTDTNGDSPQTQSKTDQQQDDIIEHSPIRSAVGGAMMGLANLVPGISGGTMLVATGVYDTFIEAIAEITRFRFRYSTIKSLLMIVIPALITVLLLASAISYLMQHQRSLMYSLFIGLTLGGVPIIIKLIKKSDDIPWTTYLGGAIGVACMILLATIEAIYGSGSKPQAGFLLFFLAGIAGASAMILPGISGGYLLLLLGAYLPIINAIKSIATALKAMDIGQIWAPAIQVALPVGLGVVVGIATVSNVIGYFFKKYKQTTLGFLAGLLLGSLAGLWPFQAPKQLTDGDIIKGQAIVLKADQWHYKQSDKPVKAKDIPHQNRMPKSVLELILSLGLIATGFGLSHLASRFDKDEAQDDGRDSS